MTRQVRLTVAIVETVDAVSLGIFTAIARKPHGIFTPPHRISAAMTTLASPLPAVLPDTIDHRAAPTEPLPKLMLGAIGVVYGDIGTSPLYTMKESFLGPHPLAICLLCL